jgi:hypothetical protein
VLEMSDRPMLQWKPDVNAGNLMTWAIVIIGIVASYTNNQWDIKNHTSRIERLENKTDTLKDDFADMKADIRVIRQILENGERVSK